MLAEFIFKLNKPGKSIVYITFIYAVVSSYILLHFFVYINYFLFLNKNEDPRQSDSRFIFVSVMNTLCKPIQPATASAIMMSLNDCLDDFDRLSEINTNYTFGINNSPMKDFCRKCHNNNSKSFLLDGQVLQCQGLQISNTEEFLKKLNCVEKDIKVKVVSILGSTCDGKSDTMNQVFFKGEEVFQISNDQNCCMLGVWTAFDPTLNVICLDTEGLIYFFLYYYSNKIILY